MVCRLLLQISVITLLKIHSIDYKMLLMASFYCVVCDMSLSFPPFVRRVSQKGLSTTLKVLFLCKDAAKQVADIKAEAQACKTSAIVLQRGRKGKTKKLFLMV